MNVWSSLIAGKAKVFSGGLPGNFLLNLLLKFCAGFPHNNFLR